MIKHWNRQDMAAAAESLFGPGWQSKMARAIDVSPRTVRRWVAGDSPVPIAVKVALEGFKREGGS